MRKSWALALGIILIVLSVCSNIYYIKYVRENADTRALWPTTNGTVLSSKVDRQPSETETGMWFTVDFAYEVNRRQYSAEQTWIVGNILATNWMGHEGTGWYFTLKTGLEQLTQRF